MTASAFNVSVRRARVESAAEYSQGEELVRPVPRAREYAPTFSAAPPTVVLGSSARIVSTHDMLLRALDWIERHLGHFVPARRHWTSNTALAALRTMLELAAVLRWLSARPLPAQAYPVIDKGLDRIAEVFHQHTFRAAFPRHHAPYLQLYLLLLVVLEESDRLTAPDDEYAIAQRLVDLGFADLTNPMRPAQGLIELRYILELGGFAHRLPTMAELFPKTVLAARTNPMYITELEVYAVTHIVFYTSDMAAKELSGLTPSQIETTARAVEQLLPHYLCARNWDLTAELLLCRAALSLPETELSALARTCIREVQRPDGAQPGPHLDLQILEKLSEPKRERYLFTHCYHTTLIAALAAAEWRGGHA